MAPVAYTRKRRIHQSAAKRERARVCERVCVRESSVAHTPKRGINPKNRSKDLLSTLATQSTGKSARWGDCAMERETCCEEIAFKLSVILSMEGVDRGSDGRERSKITIAKSLVKRSIANAHMYIHTYVVCIPKIVVSCRVAGLRLLVIVTVVTSRTE
jgi:hypothetical protein